MNSRNVFGIALMLTGGAVVSGCQSGDVHADPQSLSSVEAGLAKRGHPAKPSKPNCGKPWWKDMIRAEDGYNLHLENTVRFTALQPGADPEQGRVLFGVAADLITEDNTGALFEGNSQVAQGEITSNQRSCFTCHRGEEHDFGLPPPPLLDSIDESDPLFSGMNADAQGDPDADVNLKVRGLIKYRANRFNPQLDADDDFLQVFFWRKSPALTNVAFSQGLLLDGRSRHMFETARGAVFSHTQEADVRFDDMFATQQGQDMESFMFGLLSDPALAALRDPADPQHDALVEDPFLTVPVETKAQRRGQKVFERQCMSCHNTPNVFGNLANVMPLGNGDRPVTYPAFGPAVGKTFNVGVSERNKHGLRFSVPTGDGGFEPVVLTMAEEDGSIVELTVDMDIGLAATTRRMVDVGRFKVPQLRNLAKLAPYFHDNSEDTIEGVVDYFLSDWYRRSPAGKRFPVKMNARQRADLIEFLRIL